MPCRPRRSCSTAVRRAGFWRRYCWIVSRHDFSLSLTLADRRDFRKLPARRRDIGALALEEILDRAPQRRIDDVVRRIGRRRHVAARNLVLALGAGLDAGELVLDGVLDGLIVAELEVQER